MKSQATCRHCGGPVVVEAVGDHGYYTYPGRLTEPTCSVRYYKVTYLSDGSVWAVERYEEIDGVISVTAHDRARYRYEPKVPTTCPACGAELVEKELPRIGRVLVCPNGEERITPVEGCPHCAEGVGSVPGLHSLI